MVETQMAAMNSLRNGSDDADDAAVRTVFPIGEYAARPAMVSIDRPGALVLQSIKMIMSQGTPLSYTLPEIGVLSLITVILIALSVKNFKTRLA